MHEPNVASWPQAVLTSGDIISPFSKEHGTTQRWAILVAS